MHDTLYQFSTYWMRRLSDGTVEEFDTLGVITRRISPKGFAVRYEWDTFRERLVRIVDEKTQRATELLYDSRDKLAAVRDQFGRLTTIAVDEANDLVEVRTPDNVATHRFTYDTNHRMVDKKYAGGEGSHYVYDQWGAVTKAVNKDSLEKTFVRAADAAIVNNLAPVASVAVEGYIHSNSGSVPDYSSQPVHPMPSCLRNEYSVIDQENNKKTYLINSFGSTVSSSSADGATTRYGYAPSSCCGNVDTTIFPNQTRVIKESDARGNLLRTYNTATQAETRYTYQSIGSSDYVKTVTNALGQITRFNYDGFGNVISIVAPGGDSTSMTYTSDHLPQTVTDPQGRTTRTEYDSLGRVVRKIDAARNVTTYEYDDFGNLGAMYAPDGRKTWYEYDNMSRLTAEHDPAGGVTHYSYQADGRLDTLIDAKGQATRFTYNSQGRLASSTNARGFSRHYEYDHSGALISFTNARGQKIRYSYDELGRLISKTDTLGNVLALFNYDAMGNMNYAATPEYVINRGFDGASRLLQEIVSHASEPDTIVMADTIGAYDNRYEYKDVIISGQTVVIDGAHTFASLVLRNGAIVKHLPTTGTQVHSLSVVATDSIVIDSSSKIDVTGLGYLGGRRGDNASTIGRTVGNSVSGGSSPGSGGSHGGMGGAYYYNGTIGVAASVYGAKLRPVLPGGGGGSNGQPGYNGGGVVYLSAPRIRVSGSIVANGESALNENGGAGAGGSIIVETDSLKGFGIIAAHGGAGGIGNGAPMGGGGGRIFVSAQAWEPILLEPQGGLNGGVRGTLAIKSATGLVVENITIDSNETISATDDRYDGHFLQISNAQVVIDGKHSFKQLSLVNNALITTSSGTDSSASPLIVKVAGALFIDSTSGIDVSGKGYVGQIDTMCAKTMGYACGATGNSGGSHGSLGGNASGFSGFAYGSIVFPTQFGAGGAATSGKGGNGGGALQLHASSIRNNGYIWANGTPSDDYMSGGGAGGSIIINADTLFGKGTISAHGATSFAGGGGSGGRIALIRANFPVVYLQGIHATGGYSRNGTAMNGGPGSLYVERFDSILVDSINPGATTYVLRHNDTLASTDYSFENANVVIDGARIVMDGCHFFKSLKLQNGAVLSQLPTSLDSAKKLVVFVRDSLIVGMGTKIDVSGCGYLGDAYVNELWRGPRTLDNVAYGGSAASGCTGGSNGGTGSVYGSGVTTNSLYGTFYNPNELGSGGGCFRNETTNFGAAGGGLVRLYAKTMDLKGSVLANGSSSTRYGGGGSGGGVFISADTVRGNGTISSNGSDGYYSSDAAGGRIAVYGKYVSDSLTLTAMGSSENAGNGTAFVYQGDSLNGTIELRNPAVAGSSYPVAALIDSTDTFFEGRNITIKGHGLEVRGQHQFGVVVARDARVNFNGNIIVDSMQLSNSFCSFDTTITVLGGLSMHSNSTITHRNALEARTYNLQLQAERVYVDPSSSIDVSERGYLGDAYVNGLWRGPRTLDNVAYGGSAVSGCTGGSNGGIGSVYGSGVTPNAIYGTFYNPNELGSGGGCFRNETTNFGAAGGGLVRLYAKTIDLKGSVLANGSSSTRYGGGGSGGGIFISADTVRGNGTISSNGSDGYWTSDAGGGRIAVYGKYVSDSLTLTAMGSSVYAGNGTALVYQGDSLNGTIELRNPAVAGSSYPVDALIDSTDTFFEGRNITIKGQGLEVRGQHQFGVVVARDARVNFYGNIIVDSMQLSNSFCSFDTTITVLGGLSIHANSTITHRNALESRTYNLQLQAERVFVDASSSIDVSGRGYLGDAYVNGVWRGPRTLNNAVYGGSASSGCIGGTNGGIGSVYGSGRVTPNAIYGNFYNPNELGSGGGCYRNETANFGAAGGGLVRLYAKTIDLKGSVLANGSSSTRYGGGGSGGGIFISADTVRGNGTISSNGSDGYWTSDAGGGRIAVYGKYVSDSLTFTALGSSNAGAGTSFIRDTSRPLGVLRIDNGGNASLANATPIISIGPGTVTDLSRDTLFDTTKTFSPFVRSHLVKLNTNVVSYYEAFKVMDVETHALKVDTSAGVLTNSGSVGSAYIGVYPFDSIVVSGGAKASIAGLVFYNALYLDNGAFASYTGTQVGTLQHNGTVPDAIRMASIGSAIEGYQGAMRKCALPGSTSMLSFLSWPARPKLTLDSVRAPLAAFGFAPLPHKMYNKVVFAPITRAIKTEIAGVQNPGSLTRDSLTKNPEPDPNSEMSRIAQIALATTIPSSCPAGDPIYTYDILDRVTSMTSPVGTTTYHYDSLSGRLDTITTPQGKKFAYTYNKGQLQSLLYPNGMSAKYTFDNNGNLEDLHYQRSYMSTVQRFHYAYDTNNMRTSMSDNDGVHDYTYDSLYQIIGATHPNVQRPLEAFEYDVVGNWLGGGRVHNELNQLTEDDSCWYSYDADGNMTSTVSKATGDSTVYTWDIENRLTQVQKPGMVAQYTYDALGRRMSKTVNGVTTQFRYDREDLILEIDGNGSITASYTFGAGIDNPLMMHRDSKNYYYVKDGLGSVTALTDSMAHLVKEYQYSVFGEVLMETGLSVVNPFMYTSREYDAETGNYFYRARYYDARTGRFLNEDPISIRGGDINFYRYVSNDPVNGLDPFGTQWTDVDFVRHFYTGFGATVTLDQMGLLGTYQNTPGVCAARTAVHLDIKNKSGSSGDSFHGSLSFNPNVTAYIFSLGRGSLKANYGCRKNRSQGQCGEKNCELTCTIAWSFSDRFQDPLDVHQTIKGLSILPDSPSNPLYNFPGVPYSITGSWIESFSAGCK